MTILLWIIGWGAGLYLLWVVNAWSLENRGWSVRLEQRIRRALGRLP